jgi:carbonic anhydrase
MEWGYEGNLSPEHWGSLGPAFSLCDSGMAQSPIDMVATHRIDLVDIQFSYKDTPFLVANNGYTLEEAVPLSETVESRYPQHGQTVTIKSPDLESGQPTRIFHKDSTIVFDDDLYLLEQFHFHSPSEHTVYHKHFAIEMHLVHHNQRHEAAVVAVFMKEGKHNPVFQQFLDHAPAKVGDVVDDHDNMLNPMDLLPKGQTYYRYFGSFTTPPCHEGVIWAIMHDPIEVSAEQVKQFRTVLGHTNIRPTQPLHKRFVLESKPVSKTAQGSQ